MCEGATYGKVVPSRLFYLSSASWRKSLNCFLNFGKLKAGAHSAAAYGKVVPSCPSLLRSASCRQSLKCFAKNQSPQFQNPCGETSGFGRGGRAGAEGTAGAGGTADKRGIGAVAARTVRAEQKARLPTAALLTIYV